jgi:hypothetical protein
MKTLIHVLWRASPLMAIGWIVIQLVVPVRGWAGDPTGGNSPYANENYLNRGWLNYGLLRERRDVIVVVPGLPSQPFYSNPWGVPTGPSAPTMPRLEGR